MRLLLQCSLLLAAALAFGSGTKIVEGRLEAAPKGSDAWVLRIGTDAVPVAPDRKTRFWLHRAAADGKAFHAGDAVVARIAPDETPAALRELADKESWTWLEGIRKGVQQGTVKGFDGKHLTVTFADGTEMDYRATEKSKVELGGQPVTLGDLKTGQKLYLKGRTLPTLDVWLVQASDRMIVATAKKGATKSRGGSKASTPLKLPATGKLEGDILLHQQGMGMFDVMVDGRLLHVNYLRATFFTLGGTKCGPEELIHDRKVTVAYKRDQYGRIIAAKVDIR